MVDDCGEIHMTDKDFVMHESDLNDDAIDNYGRETYGNADLVNRQELSKLLKIAGVVFLIFVILFIFVISKIQNLQDKKQVLAIEKRLDRLETDFTLLTTDLASKLDQTINELKPKKQTTAKQKASAAKTPPPSNKEQKDVEPKIHKIQAGDTLYQISQQYGLTLEQLRDYNNLEPNTIIYPGQELKLTPRP